MFRMRVKHDLGTMSELPALAAQPDCQVLPDAYNPPGFPGSLGPASDADREAFAAALEKRGRPIRFTFVLEVPGEAPFSMAVQESSLAAARRRAAETLQRDGRIVGLLDVRSED